MNRRTAVVVSLLVLLLGAVSVVSAQAPLTLPDLTGSYQVSRTNYDLTDSSRDETFTETPDDKREILVTVYYPADPAADAKPAPYMDQTLQKATAQQAGVPYFLLNISTHVYENQPAAADKFPLLIFSPGFGN